MNQSRMTDVAKAINVEERKNSRTPTLKYAIRRCSRSYKPFDLYFRPFVPSSL
jgi:hypothetical protein